jgi:hypothetical protein
LFYFSTAVFQIWLLYNAWLAFGISVQSVPWISISSIAMNFYFCVLRHWTFVLKKSLVLKHAERIKSDFCKYRVFLEKKSSRHIGSTIGSKLWWNIRECNCLELEVCSLNNQCLRSWLHFMWRVIFSIRAVFVPSILKLNFNVRVIGNICYV